MRAEYFALVNQADRSLSSARRALELLPRENHFERAFAAIRLQRLLGHTGEFEAGRAVLRAQLQDAVDEGSPWVTCVHIALATSHAQAGDLSRARRGLELFEHVSGHGQPYNECLMHYSLGRIAYEWNELEAAAEHFRCGALDHGGNYTRAVECQLGLALIDELRGRPDEAGRALEQALGMARAIRSEELATLVLSCRTRLLLMRGRSASATVTLAPAVQEDPLILCAPIEIPRLTESRRLIQRGRAADLAEAQRILEEAVDFLRSAHIQTWLPQALALLALVHKMRDQKSRALSTLRQAVELATSGGLVRSFLDLGPDLVGLLYELKLTGPAADHVATILSAAAAEEPATPAAKPHGASIQPLTTRELEVLRLLADNLSDKEIAAALCISPLTVRKHTAHILAKLNVRNRREASDRALQVGLVRPRRHAPA